MMWSIDNANGPLGTVDSLQAHAVPEYRSLPDPNVPVEEVGRQGWRLQDLLLPAMTVRASALRQNAALHARWCREVDVDQAPHVKTHMSPQIVALQRDSGAWGMTAASVHQARFVAACGLRRIIIAQQVVDPASLAALASLLRGDPERQVLVIADSVAGVRAMAAALERVGPTSPLRVLVEVGLPGGRTGVRSRGELESVAREVVGSPALALAGIEGFEGILPPGRDEASLDRVDTYLAGLTQAVAHLDRLGLFESAEEIVLSAGGSVYPDRVAAVDRPTLSRPLRIVVRSGATIVHDHGPTAACAPLAPQAHHPLGALRPALDIWASVVSAPEPRLALANMGKRDAPYDARMPFVLEVRRGSQSLSPAGAVVERMNDQHAYLSHDGLVQVGDVLRLGPSHPCTAFDKWRLLPVLDDDDGVIGAITTHF